MGGLIQNKKKKLVSKRYIDDLKVIHRRKIEKWFFKNFKGYNKIPNAIIDFLTSENFYSERCPLVRDQNENDKSELCGTMETNWGKKIEVIPKFKDIRNWVSGRTFAGKKLKYGVECLGGETCE